MAASRLGRSAARAATGVALAAAVAGPFPLSALAQGAAAASMIEDSPGHYAFSPSAATVPMGATVTWTDKSDAPHTVTSDAGAFGSNAIRPNQAFRFTFNQAGTFAYHCSIHPYMHGTIVVEGAAQSATAATSAAQPAATARSAPAQTPGQMPSTGAGGTAAPPGGSLAVVVVGLGALLAGLRRRRERRGRLPWEGGARS